MEAARPGDAAGSPAAAEFGNLTDAQGQGAAAAGTAVGDRPVSEPRRVAAVSVEPAGPAHAAGEGVLSNVPLAERQAAAVRRATPAEAVAAKSSMDMSGMIDLLRTQAEVAHFRARVGLAAAGVQRSTQGLDTLLKSQ